MSSVSALPTTSLSQSSILRLYWPLAMSWMLMAVDGPVCQAVISHRPDANLNLAAYQIFFSIAMWVESPVIDLLSTSTTLARGKATRARLQSFTLAVMAGVSVIHAIIALTPLFDWLAITVLKVQPDVAAHARSGFVMMIPWSAAIGWRRYLQGVLIRQGQTRVVAAGTMVRVAAIAVAALILSNLAALEAATVAGLVLVGGVVCEMLYIHFASREACLEMDRNNDETEAEKLTVHSLIRFHLPLTLTTMLVLCGTPATVAAVDRLANPVVTLAAVQVSSSLLWLLRSFTYALPELTIALYKSPQSLLQLKKFCIYVGLASAALTAGLALSGLAENYFSRVLGTPADSARLGAYGVVLGSLIPIVAAGQSYLRGVLTAHHLTQPRMIASFSSILLLGILLLVGVALRLPGIVVATVVPGLAVLADYGLLLIFWRVAKANGHVTAWPT